MYYDKRVLTTTKIGLRLAKEVHMPPTILFLCPHGAAKSVMAAAYFQRLAEQQGIDVHATAADVDPSPEISPAVIELLAQEGIDVSGHAPQRVTREQIDSAGCVVSLGCDLDTSPLANIVVEQWDDVPLPSQDLVASRNRIYEHVAQLVERYKTV
jgi:arsenate reductase (thioredoxin)